MPTYLWLGGGVHHLNCSETILKHPAAKLIIFNILWIFFLLRFSVSASSPLSLVTASWYQNNFLTRRKCSIKSFSHKAMRCEDSRGPSLWEGKGNSSFSSFVLFHESTRSQPNKDSLLQHVPKKHGCHCCVFTVCVSVFCSTVLLCEQ